MLVLLDLSQSVNQTPPGAESTVLELAREAVALLGWALDTPGGYWGDDNARALLGLAATSALVGDTRWDDALLRCLLAGFADQLCIRRDTGTLECELTEGRIGTLMRESVVQAAPLFVAATLREVSGRTSGPRTLLGLATAGAAGLRRRRRGL